MSEIENINFIGYCGTWLKDSIYAFTNIGVEFLMHIQIFNPVEASFFSKGIQYDEYGKYLYELSKCLFTKFKGFKKDGDFAYIPCEVFSHYYVTIAGSLWTRYLILKSFMYTFAFS